MPRGATPVSPVLQSFGTESYPVQGRPCPMDPIAEANAPGIVLIADDNSEARRMLEHRVKREGHTVLLVENGKQVLDVLASQPVDVVLLDIYMPEKDGFEVLTILKADPH